MLELLVFALQDLKKLLKDQGSDLLIGFGTAEDVIVKLVTEVAWQNFLPSSVFNIMYMHVTWFLSPICISSVLLSCLWLSSFY